ncbi:hypothetical protein ACOSP7_018416 [Xanthoceras sorbifolium]
MVGVGCRGASAFVGWTCVGPCSIGFTVGVTICFICCYPIGLITTGSGAKEPLEVSGFRSPAVDLSSKIGYRELELSVAGVTCLGADVRLALISYRSCLNLSSGVVVVVSDSTLVCSSLFSEHTTLFFASRIWSFRSFGLRAVRAEL